MAFTNPHWLKQPVDRAQRSVCRVEDLASAGLSPEYAPLLPPRGGGPRDAAADQCMNMVLSDVLAIFEIAESTLVFNKSDSFNKSTLSALISN